MVDSCNANYNGCCRANYAFISIPLHLDGVLVDYKRDSRYAIVDNENCRSSCFVSQARGNGIRVSQNDLLVFLLEISKKIDLGDEGAGSNTSSVSSYRFAGEVVYIF